jgi:hypothetical protein
MNHPSTIEAKEDHVAVSQSAMKYWAFISYSHQDKKWGDWLHKTLEGYRVPKRLTREETREGSVPRRIFPIFRDREELPTSSSLNQAIAEAIKASRCLIVICSPQSARSRWVNEEILAFKRLGRSAHILCLIVAGEPNASDKPKLGGEECFPEALRYEMGPDGKLTDRRVEPIAADVRPGSSPKHEAILKLVAGVIGVGYDKLRQRDRRRRMRQITQWTFIIIVILTIMTSFLFSARQQVRQAGQEVQVIQEIREKERNLPFRRMSGTYSEPELNILRDRVAAGHEDLGVAKKRYDAGVAMSEELAQSAHACFLAEAELAWATRDLDGAEKNLQRALEEANRLVEIRKIMSRVSSRDGVNAKVQAAQAKTDTELALTRLRAYKREKSKPKE